MALSDVVANFKQALEQVPGVKSVLLPYPDIPPEEAQCPFIGIHVGEVEFLPSNLTMLLYPMTISYMHTRMPDDRRYEMPPEVWDMPQTIFNTLAARVALMAGYYSFEVREAAQIGTGFWLDEEYVGCSMIVVPKEKEATPWA